MTIQLMLLKGMGTNGCFLASDTCLACGIHANCEFYLTNEDDSSTLNIKAVSDQGIEICKERATRSDGYQAEHIIRKSLPSSLSASNQFKKKTAIQSYDAELWVDPT